MEEGGKRGLCNGALTFWFFNQNTNACESFIYGGCEAGSSQNKFVTKEVCEQTCGNWYFIKNKTYQVPSNICLIADNYIYFSFHPKYIYWWNTNKCTFIRWTIAIPWHNDIQINGPGFIFLSKMDPNCVIKLQIYFSKQKIIIPKHIVPSHKKVLSLTYILYYFITFFLLCWFSLIS